MSTATQQLTPRERELGAIIRAYNEVTEGLKRSHEKLGQEVRRLHEELSNKNRQLRRRERLAALGEMAAGVAHEIRNPLGGIGMFASLLRKDLADRPDAVRLVEKIIKGVKALERVVNDTLDFGRPSEPQPGTVQVETLVRETLELAATRVPGVSVDVEPFEGEGGRELVSDAALMQRALLNIVLNAMEAALTGRGPGDARVRVRLKGTTDRVTISVADNGAGIPVELMDRIFNPFFTTKDSGTGLGLAIVHQIAETLGGTVQAANRAGGGATFSLSLPRRMNEDTSGDDRTQ